MIDAKTHCARRQTGPSGSSQSDADHPLPLRPKAHLGPQPAEVSATEANEKAAAEGAEPDDAVGHLAGALRTAERAHRAYLAELRQGDVEPTEEWSTWYAEYLLGLR
jgi:predicted component of type VI protein secretion system